MAETFVIALISLLGTLVGTFGGILTSNKLTVYRIEILEKKLESYTATQNDIAVRVVKLEDNDNLIDEKIKVINNRIKDLERIK